MANIAPNICGYTQVHLTEDNCDCCEELRQEIAEIWERLGNESNVVVGTTQYWTSQPNLIGEKDVVYVYTDHLYNDENEPVPAFKVGDGLAYLIDLPFDDDIMMAHIANNIIHITQSERNFWNSKVTAYIDANDSENLVLDDN